MSSVTASVPAPCSAACERPRAIANLLLFVAGLVFAMVVMGGITRLTEADCR